MASSRTGTLVVEQARGRGRDDEFFYVAKWRASLDSRQMKRRLGPAWLAAGEDGKPHPRRGRIKPDFLDERRAYARMAEVIERCEDEDARREEIDAARKRAGWTFGALADAWLDHAERVRRLKPSTMRDLQSILAHPGVSKRRGGGAVKARLMTMLGDVPAASIIVDDVEDYFRLLADDGAGPRTVNRHREVLRAIFNYGCSTNSGFELENNPAAQTDLRRQDGPRPLEIFSVEQVEHLARAAAEGSWRATVDWSRAPRTVAHMRLEDAQLGELLRMACYCGLRRGELVLLQWDDVRWTDRVLVVRRALSDGVEVLPKSGRARYVPLADQALAALERLSRRGDFTQADDYVFINAVGGHLDPSALRRRYVRVRDNAGLPPLRFHDLRHTAGSLLVRHMDPASVKDILGHADLARTERYLHAQRASLLADAATRAFTACDPTDPDEQLAAVLRDLSPERRASVLGRLASGAPTTDLC